MAVASPKLPAPAPSIPPLENGDHLARAEFERRYQAMPDVKKAELIEGVVYMPSPVQFRGHSQPHQQVTTWLGTYAAGTPGVECGSDGSIRLDFGNEPQPDVFLFLPPHAGGQVRIDADDYVAGAPELVVEVASSSVSRDLNAKRAAYARNGVRAYVVWRAKEGALDWFVLRGGEFVLAESGPGGVYRSEVFPGLWLDVPALLNGDLAAVLRVLQEGIASREHGEFAAQVAPQE